MQQLVERLARELSRAVHSSAICLPQPGGLGGQSRDVTVFPSPSSEPGSEGRKHSRILQTFALTARRCVIGGMAGDIGGSEAFEVFKGGGLRLSSVTLLGSLTWRHREEGDIWGLFSRCSQASPGAFSIQRISHLSWNGNP